MRTWLRRLRYVLRNRSAQDDIAAEIQFHRAMIERDLEERGLAADDARRGAQRALGNDLVARERSHDVWIAPAIQDLAGDLRLAGRLALKEYGFTAAAVVTLALGIAAVTTVFTIVNAMVLRGLPVEHPHRVVSFESGGRPMAVSYQDVEDWRSATAFDGLAVLNARTMTVADEGRSHDVFFGAHISAHAFTLLGVRPVLGRSFTRDDDRSGAPAVVILGHRVWAGRYDSDPGVVGRTIRVNETPATVIGVMPIGFRFPATEDMWLPLAAMPGLVTDRREPRTLRVWGRLAGDVPMARAQAELDAITERLARDHADTNRNVRPVIVPYTGTANHPIFVALFGAMGFLLLIACANVANLLLARAARRAREISIRASLGASRWRIVRQLLSESGLLAIAAGVGGLLLSIGAVHWFSTIVEGINFPYWYRDRWTMDGRVFTFVAGICVGTTILFGLLPALHLSRTDVSRGLKDGGRGGTAGPAASRWTNALLAAQVTFTVVLLVGAGLMLRSLVLLFDADRLLDTTNLFRVSVRLPPPSYPSAAERLAFFEKVERQLEAVEPIASATVTTASPFIGAATWQLGVEGRAQSPDGPLPSVMFAAVGANYFDTLRLPLIRGRAFDSRDGTAGYESAIVNQRLAAMFFGHEDPIGRRIRLVNPNRKATPAEITATIVGISPTLRQNFFEDISPVVYVPYRVNPAAGTMLIVRTRADAGGGIAALRESIRAIDADAVAHNATAIETDRTQSRWGNTVFGTMIAMAAGISLLLAAVGLYAVTAYGVTQRLQEIGVRLALGAEARSIVWLFVRRTLVPLGAGLALGLAGAIGVGRIIRSMLIQTSPTDPATFAGIVILLVSVALAAVLRPARRGARMDPAVVLRAD